MYLKGGESGELKVKSDCTSQSFRALITATLLVLMLLNVILLSSVSPVFAESEPEEEACSTCLCCKQTQCSSLSGGELKKAVASALSNKDVRKLLTTFATQGYTPRIDEASVLVISDITFIGIPFDTHEGAYSAGIAFTPETNRALGAVINPIDETHAWITMYYIDSQGEMVSTTFLDDWNSCVGECILHIVDIMHLSGLLELCWGSCALCILPPHISCAICLACMGAPVAGCATACAIACWLWGC